MMGQSDAMGPSDATGQPDATGQSDATGRFDATGQFDPFANQGGPAAEDAASLAEARRVTDEQLRNADYSVDLPEPLGGEREGGADLTGEDSDTGAAGDPDGGPLGDPRVGSAGDPDAASASDLDPASASELDPASAGDQDADSPAHAERHARRLLAGEGAPIDDAPVSTARANAAERSGD